MGTGHSGGVSAVKESLADAFVRLERAKEHIDNLEREIYVVGSSPLIRDAYLQWASPVGTGIFVNLAQDPPIVRLPRRIGVLVGETVYNLRAALDYLAFQLAVLDSSQIRKGTQFPIESSQDDWQRIINPPPKWRSPKRFWLGGIRPEHRKAIGIFQPCNECRWTEGLAALSNPDKHRTIHAVFGSGPLVEVSSISADADPGKYTNVSLHVPLDVAFDDGSLVEETLRMLDSEVGSTLDHFKPCFDGQCKH